MTLIDLLRCTPEEHVLSYFNRAYGTSLSPHEVEVTSPVEYNGKTKVTITPRVRVGCSRTILGSIDFIYDRLSVESVFGTSVAANVKFPITTTDLMIQVGKTSGMIVVENDFVHEVIEDYNCFIAASPQSLRWKGGLFLGPPRDTRYHVGTLVGQNNLNGFVK